MSPNGGGVKTTPVVVCDGGTTATVRCTSFGNQSCPKPSDVRGSDPQCANVEKITYKDPSDNGNSNWLMSAYEAEMVSMELEVGAGNYTGNYTITHTNSFGSYAIVTYNWSTNYDAAGNVESITITIDVA
jgi:hypothetical protein